MKQMDIHMRQLFFSLLTIFTGLALVGCSRGPALPQAGIIELSEAFKADFDLIDMDGNQVSDETYRGQSMLIYFGFASCPDVCPAALGKMSATLDALGKDAGKIQALFITVDPERDTPEILKAHLAFDPRITGLNGTLAQATTAWTNMRVSVTKVPTPDSALAYTMSHQSMFYVIDAAGVAQVALLDDLAPKELAAAISQHF